MDLRRATKTRPLAREVVQLKVERLLDAVDRDPCLPTSHSLREMTVTARRSVWALAHIRHGMKDHETRITDNWDYDAGRKWLIGKMRLANYFLDMSESMLVAVVDKKNPSLFRLFGDAMKHIADILDHRFLSEKSPGELSDAYYAGEVHITACAYACDITPRSLNDVGKNYRPVEFPEPEPLSYPERPSQIPSIG